MYTTYKEYLKQETSLPFEEAMQIWNQIAEQGEADAACRELIDRFKYSLYVVYIGYPPHILS